MLIKINTAGYAPAKLAFRVLVARVTACADFLPDPDRKAASWKRGAERIRG